MANVGELYIMVPQSNVSGAGVSGGDVGSGGCSWVAIPIAQQSSTPILAKVVTMPTGGAGLGAVKPVLVATSGGVIVGSGASISVVMPYLDGAN